MLSSTPFHSKSLRHTFTTQSINFNKFISRSVLFEKEQGTRLRRRWITNSSSNTNQNDENHALPIASLPSRFLRQSDSSLFDYDTHQRTDVTFDKNNAKLPKSSSFSNDEVAISKVTLDANHNEYKVEWEDSKICIFDSQWVDTQLQRRLALKQDKKVKRKLDTKILPIHDISKVIPRIPWSNLTENDIRSFSQLHKTRFKFSDIVTNDDKSIDRAVKGLFQYGILFVTSTPTEDGGAGVAALASALSGPAHKSSPETTLLAHYLHCKEKKKLDETYDSKPLSILERGSDGPQRTMYGNIWSTNVSQMSGGQSVADSAYGNDALPLHTDFAYFRDPPGLQIFTMVSDSETGGESIFADGLAVAEYMRSNHPKEFDILCRTMRRYRSLDNETGWHLEGTGPIIEAIDLWQNCRLPESTKLKESRWGAVVGIRHNDLDRMPDLPRHFDVSEEGFDAKFYNDLHRAHAVWNNLLSSDEFRLVIKLKPGETMVVSNQRCLHGRYSFETSTSSIRAIIGCYVSQDDLESRFRWMMKGVCTFN